MVTLTRERDGSRNRALDAGMKDMFSTTVLPTLQEVHNDFVSLDTLTQTTWCAP